MDAERARGGSENERITVVRARRLSTFRFSLPEDEEDSRCGSMAIAQLLAADAEVREQS